MPESIYGLQYDYIHKSSDYLIFSKKENLHSSELADLQVKMLQANSIPKLLPLEIEENDLIVQLRYNFSAKRMLSHSLKGQKLSLHEYYKLLFSIASVLDDSKNYMLNEASYIIHEDFIYIGSDYEDLYLIYVPIYSLPEKKKVREEMKSLAMNLIGSLQELQGDSLQELLNYFKQENFSLTDFRRNLVHLMNKSIVSPNNSQRIENKSALDRNSNRKIELDQQAHRESFPSNKVKISNEENIVNDTAQLTRLSSREKTYLFLGAFVLMALIWRGYLESQSEGLLYLSIGLSIMVVNLVFIFLKIWRPGIKAKVKPGIPKIKNIDIEPQNSNPILGKETALQRHGETPKKQSFSHYEELHRNTSLLSNSEATVLLTEDSPQQFDNDSKGPRAILEVQREGRVEKIELNNESFIIGRNAEMANYVENSFAVSRAHTELRFNGKEYKVKDLGSRNGTLLNQEKLIPNKEYFIEEGDLLMIAKTEFIFKMEYV
jgi:hypothetical protein